jgi:hypothetical protein
MYYCILFSLTYDKLGFITIILECELLLLDLTHKP